MHHQRKSLTIGLGLALVAASGAVAAPTFASTPDDASSGDGFAVVADQDSVGGTLYVQVDYDTAEAGGLDPALAEVARSWSLMGLVYESLVTVGPNFAIESELADFEQPDDTTYVFTLRDGATFSNGRAVTAADVVGSLERLRESGSVWSGQLGPIASIEDTSSDGAEQVTITLESPYTPLLAALANTPAAILPIEELDAGEFDPETEMLGSGPFVVGGHRQDESWLFEANPEWNDGELGVDAIDITIAVDDQVRLAGLRDGSIHLANFSNPDAIDLLAGAGDVATVSQTQSDFFYLMLNSVNPESPFAEPDVRQAVNAAIDRQTLVDIGLAGAALPTAVTPANLPGACSADDVPSASAEVADGALDDLAATLLVYNDDPALVALGQLVQQQLNDAGADIELETLDYATYVERVYTAQPGDFDMAMSWFAGYGDPSMVATWWNPEAAFFNVGFTGVHEDLNAAIAAAQSTPTGDERTAALAELCTLVDDHAEMLPLATRPQVIGYRTDTLAPTILADEGYGDFLRLVTEFALLDG